MRSKIGMIGLIFGFVLFLMITHTVWGQEREKKNRPGSSETPIILEGHNQSIGCLGPLSHDGEMG